ncbi:hypothetical protein Pcinc_010246 [Petrolisthes cinctipes]|uniref:Uncharacterized protein n=1 Tax=Petrolisthes cinctipes TaxID=88211 RepID=A0AAE1KXJ7_PETCI|nr:hypothetical protein Pcinc_010246 [Petrolisthes cinctipes]
MADSWSVTFKTPGIRLLIRLRSSRNANNGNAVGVYRATAGTDDVLTKHLHACSARSPIRKKGTTFSLSLSPNHCDTWTLPRHLLHVPPPHHHAQNAKEWQENLSRIQDPPQCLQ